jgi:hypothetical protein
MVDCNSCVSELVNISMIKAEMRPTFMKQNEEKIFTWKRLELFACWDEDQQGQFQVQARLTFNKLKATKGTTKGTRQKVIALRLPPLDLAAKDTLRWLIILGLIDSVFGNIQKWADLDSVLYSLDDIKISIEKEFLDIPVSWHPIHS